MRRENEFQIRPGHIRARSAQRVRPFIHQVLAAAQKAGATVRRGRITTGRSGFGRGRQAAHIANRLLTNRSRLAVIKARVVRHHGRTTPLKAHLRYLQREGVTRDGDKASLFGPDRDGLDGKAFAERCEDDRHHFRFIVSPEDAVQMEDLQRFTRDLMTQAEADLGTGLDWVAVTHWNTEHPHVHIIVRGVTDIGDDLVISRDYIKDGMRARAQGLITDELGPRTDFDIHQSLHRQIESERFTQLDRQLLLDAKRDGMVDLAPGAAGQADEFQVLKAGRIRKLESLGLADQFAPGQWVMSERTEAVLRDLGARGDIIKRIHRGLTEGDIARSTESFVLDASQSNTPIVGRLLARGLDDELKGTAYLIVDGTDGRTHHVSVPSLEQSGDCPLGAIVTVSTELRDNARRTFVRIESDLDLRAQVSANGATWLDRQLVKAERPPLAATGFGAEVQNALERRGEHLVDQGLAAIDGAAIRPNSGLIQTLRQRELDQVANAFRNAGARSVTAPGEGENVAGIYRQRLDLASGRFAVLDDGMGFQLVPWSPKIDAHVGEAISGHMRSHTAVSWDLGLSKSVGIEI
jgi:type IV secretory pathway VirD2 relaxase